MALIQRERSIIPACDVRLDVFDRLVRDTASIAGVGAYKISAALAMSAGLGEVVKVARHHTDKPLIYDHQKAGTDIPDTAEFFMETLSAAGVNAVILFPLAGPATQTAWTAAALNHELDVLVGGRMTHSSFVASEGGYLVDNAPERVYDQAATQGVRHFVVPGNRPEVISQVRERVSLHCAHPVFVAPGFVAQGGEITAAARAAGAHWHAIVGRAIYEAPSMRDAAAELSSAL